MNFDTKYLIRWGIPGWIMILTLFPYFFITYFEIAKKVLSTSATDILAIGAVLTFLGVPLGYVLNQVHHSLFWVMRKSKNEWDLYFQQEIIADESHLLINEFKNNRYRYLLSKKHELGGVAVSLCVSTFVILCMNLSTNEFIWAWMYFIVVISLSVVIVISRNYSSKNVHFYFYDYLLKPENDSNANVDNNSNN